ncbi:MAG TPA: class I SAM-dependent methyltransferase [Polyangiaceae bacterium]|nr:class I SAM-dependent methyltransferase [Polyangiaceae bacterium]
MNVRLDAARSYLDVRYSERERPYTDYPAQLTAYLTERYLHARRGEALLDLGCGRGEFLHGFAQLGFSATGFDRSRPEKPRFSEPVVEGDYEQGGLPFADGQFSVLFNKSVFEHVRDISPLLRECHRVLAPGGRMVSLVPDWTAQWRHFYDDWTHVRPFTLVGLRQCIQSHGFEVREALRFRQLPLLWEKPYLRPLSDAAALLPDAFKRSKFVRFSKEWMLLVVADRVG